MKELTPIIVKQFRKINDLNHQLMLHNKLAHLKLKCWQLAISSDTHQLHYISKHYFII